MPKHYAVDTNVKEYSVRFNNTKSAEVEFGTDVFTKKPIINLSMADSGTLPAYKSVITATSVIIRFKSNWTGWLDVTALERG